MRGRSGVGVLIDLVIVLAVLIVVLVRALVSVL